MLKSAGSRESSMYSSRRLFTAKFQKEKILDITKFSNECHDLPTSRDVVYQAKVYSDVLQLFSAYITLCLYSMNTSNMVDMPDLPSPLIGGLSQQTIASSPQTRQKISTSLFIVSQVLLPLHQLVFIMFLVGSTCIVWSATQNHSCDYCDKNLVLTCDISAFIF